MKKKNLTILKYDKLLNSIVLKSLKKYDLNENEFKDKLDIIAQSSMKKYTYDINENLAEYLSITFYINNDINKYLISLANHDNEMYEKISNYLSKILKICYNISNKQSNDLLDVEYYMEYSILKTIENYNGIMGIDMFACKWFMGLLSGKLNEESTTFDECEKVLVK